ncbi:MAG: hypothetical protein AAB497_02565 [Patescibacteria group bacterium]
MHTCTVCGGEKPQFALPLKKEKGEWVVKPICGSCRYNLGKEARAQKKFIPMYELGASLNEVAKRNAEIGRLKPFLEAFARQVKVVRKGDKRPAVAKAS